MPPGSATRRQLQSTALGWSFDFAIEQCVIPNCFDGVSITSYRMRSNRMLPADQVDFESKNFFRCGSD
jgi:hypothetical protein